MVKQLHPVNLEKTNVQLFMDGTLSHNILFLSFAVGLRHMSK